MNSYTNTLIYLTMKRSYFENNDNLEKHEKAHFSDQIKSNNNPDLLNEVLILPFKEILLEKYQNVVGFVTFEVNSSLMIADLFDEKDKRFFMETFFFLPLE